MILYHHLGYELRDELIEENSTSIFLSSSDNDDELNTKSKPTNLNNDEDSSNVLLKKSQSCTADFFTNTGLDSGLYLYVDFHGHASKKGYQFEFIFK